MRDFLKRHRLVALTIKTIVFLGLLAAIGTFVLGSYFDSESNRIPALDPNSAATVSQALSAGTPVFIEACRPVCELQLPEVEAAAQELEGRVLFFQIDPEAQPDLMAALENILQQPIATFPAHIVLAAQPALQTGPRSAAQLVDFILQAAQLQDDGAAPAVNSTAQPTINYQNISVVNEQTIEQELAGVTIPVYVFLCEGHECEIQAQALDTVAGRYAGRVKFIQINWFENPNITVGLVRGAQMPLAFPIHVILSPEGTILNYASMVLQEAQLEAFITDALSMASGNSPSTPTSVPTATPVRPDSTTGGAR